MNLSAHFLLTISGGVPWLHNIQNDTGHSNVRSFVHVRARGLSERHCLSGRTSVIIMESYALIIGATLKNDTRTEVYRLRVIPQN